MVSEREKKAFKGHFIDHQLPVLNIEKQSGKQEISTVRMSFSKIFYFCIILAALYLSSNSVSARTGGGVLLRKSGQARKGGGMGLKTGNNVRTSFIDDHKSSKKRNFPPSDLAPHPEFLTTLFAVQLDHLSCQT